MVTLELDLGPTNAIHTVTDVFALVSVPAAISKHLPGEAAAAATATAGFLAAAAGGCGVGVHEIYGNVSW